MALTDQPYIPLYVDDWMNNSKLKMCSPGAHGLMISIMCLMHKNDEYGIILLKQKFKQEAEQRKNFASQVAKLTSFDLLEIENYFYELLDEKVLKIEGEKLICGRMVKDATISKNRAFSGSKGGKKTQNSNKNFALANVEANTGIENEYGIEYEIVKGKEGVGEKPKKFSYKETLLSLVNDIQLVDDYIALRKLKKAPLSKTAFDSLMSECLNNSFDIAEALRICIQKNWQGFKVQWVLNDRAKDQANTTPAGGDKQNIIGRQSEEIVKSNYQKFLNNG